MRKSSNIPFLILGFIFVSSFTFAQKAAAPIVAPIPAASPAAPAVAAPKAAAPKKEEKVIRFAPKSKRDPFLSMAEVDSIEKARLAEQKRLSDERSKLEGLERARRDELEKQRRYEEELKRNPARAIIDKITIDGILGNEAIINGDIKGIGSTVLGAQVVKVSDNSVTFTYKGQRFVKKLPLI